MEIKTNDKRKQISIKIKQFASPSLIRYIRPVGENQIRTETIATVAVSCLISLLPFLLLLLLLLLIIIILSVLFF